MFVNRNNAASNYMRNKDQHAVVELMHNLLVLQQFTNNSADSSDLACHPLTAKPSDMDNSRIGRIAAVISYLLRKCDGSGKVVGKYLANVIGSLPKDVQDGLKHFVEGEEVCFSPFFFFVFCWDFCVWWVSCFRCF